MLARKCSMVWEVPVLTEGSTVVILQVLYVFVILVLIALVIFLTLKTAHYWGLASIH